MPVILARHMGFCGGVKRAIALAQDRLRDGGALVALGPLVHNQQQMEELQHMGLIMADDPGEINNRPTIIRSHGVGPTLRESVVHATSQVVDATCPSVQRIFDLAHSLTGDGYRVVIVGEKGHPEVEAAREWAGDSGQIVETPEDADELPEMEHLAVLAQSTLEEARFDAVVNRLRGKAKDLRVERTICGATRLRQEAAVELASRVDLMLVIGGRHSANTKHLYELCHRVNGNCHQVERAQEVRTEWVKPGMIIGVTAGASTPEWIIKEVEQIVSELEKKPEEQVQQEPQHEEQAPQIDEERMPEDAYLPRRLSQGDLVKATVVSVADDGIMIDVGWKSEGFVPRKELAVDQSRTPAELVKVGDEIEVTVIRSEDKEGNITFSKRRADQLKNWDKITDAKENNQTLTGRVTEAVKGGLVVDIGVRAFLPASMVDRRFISDLNSFVGQDVQVRVVEMEKERRNVIVSRKAVAEEENSKAKETLWAAIQEGEIRHGVVRRLTDFGAFVDLGGVDGLLHISDISHGRIKHPSEVVNVGSELDLVVLKLDRERGRISLGL
ncbi:MAG: 4-hydroxy-3-methylbut-2-enyl diphosphate reductase, partial [Bacillota bacterium]